MNNKTAMTQAIIMAKHKKKTTWGEIASKTGLSEVFTVSACMGQNTLAAEEAEKLGQFLDLSQEIIQTLQVYPTKGEGQEVPTDPLIYRFFEINYVYGTTLKELIQEKFGDGIMSAIDFTMHIEKINDPKGDRVQVIYNGKFLPYKKW
jgi:cyanate lyase